MADKFVREELDESPGRLRKLNERLNVKRSGMFLSIIEELSKLENWRVLHVLCTRRMW